MGTSNCLNNPKDNCGPRKANDIYCLYHKPNKDSDEAKEFYKKITEKAEIVFNENQTSRLVYNFDVNWKGYIFPKVKTDVYFKNGSLCFEELFNRAMFCGSSNFLEAVFEGELNFVEAVFHGSANFSQTKFLAIGSLGRTVFYDRADFTGAVFHNHFSFGGANYNGDACFILTTFFKESNFGGTRFNGLANFTQATYIGPANYKGASFNNKAGFGMAKFKNIAIFEKTKFGGGSSFERALFNGEAKFREAKFNCTATFRLTSFNRNAYFDRTTFKDFALFDYGTFKNDIFFDYTIFEKTCTFLLTKFEKGLSFRNTYFHQGVKMEFDWREKEVDKYAHPQAEHEGCRVQKHAYEKEGDREAADNLFVREMRAKRSYCLRHKYNQRKKAFSNMSFRENIFLKKHPAWRCTGSPMAIFHKYTMKTIGFTYIRNLLEIVLIDATCRYGTDWWALIKSSVLIIFSFSFFYFLSNYLPILGNLNTSPQNLLEAYLNSLYFSIITFSTVGYGEIYPEGCIRFLAGFQSLVGAFFVALFVVVFARKWMRN